MTLHLYELITWGSSAELGNGGFVDSLSIVSVSGLTDVAQVNSGGWFGCALKTNGTVYCWGNAWAGRTGVPFSNHWLPTSVQGP